MANLFPALTSRARTPSRPSTRGHSHSPGDGDGGGESSERRPGEGSASGYGPSAPRPKNKNLAIALPPPLRATLSLSSLHGRAGASAPGTPWPSTSNVAMNSPHLGAPSALPPHLTQPGAGIASSGSSMINVDMHMSESMLRDVEGDADADAEPEPGADGEAVGRMDGSAVNEGSKAALREQLRRTLSVTETSNADMAPRPSRPRTNTKRKGKMGDGLGLGEVPVETADMYPPRQYFVLTDAGKPVFTTRADEDSEEATAAMGIMQALISVFLEGDGSQEGQGDKLRCINAGATRITFLVRAPLYLVCVSAWREPESVTRTHLEYLHLQILSIVSAAQLRRIFERRTNFDLRRLLQGTEPLLKALLTRMEADMAISTGSLLCLRLEPGLRARVAATMVPGPKIKQDILYVLLVARGRVVTLVRPKKHSIHPSDLHILLNTVHAPSVFNSSASASWLPVCLPKYNSAAFLHAYVSFLRNEEVEFEAADGGALAPVSEVEEDDGGDGPDVTGETRGKEGKEDGHNKKLGLGLVVVSSGGDFERTRAWADSVSLTLQAEGTLGAITHAIRSGVSTYSVSALSIPGLRHFVYKSRAHVQVTLPVFEDPYDEINERRRLVTLYQTLYDAIHAKSGQEGALKLMYVRTERESLMGWITQPFELYLSVSPRLPKTAIVGAANAVARWVKKEEGRLFLRDAPVF